MRVRLFSEVEVCVCVCVCVCETKCGSKTGKYIKAIVFKLIVPCVVIHC